MSKNQKWKFKPTVAYFCSIALQVIFLSIGKWFLYKASTLMDYKSGIGDFQAAQPYEILGSNFYAAWLVAVFAMIMIFLFFKSLRNADFLGLSLFMIFSEVVVFFVW